MSIFTDAERDAGDLAKLVNEDAAVVTRYGKQAKKSWLKLQAEFEAGMGFNDAGTFASGFTYEKFNDVGRDADGNPWIYIGGDSNYPVNIAPGTNPAAFPSLYAQRGYNDHEALANRNTAGAHPSSAITNSDQLTVQDTHDATKAMMIAQGLSGNFGFFEKGFTYNEAGDVGIDFDGKIYTYVGSGAPTKSVVAGTAPSGDDDYKLININTTNFSLDNNVKGRQATNTSVMIIGDSFLEGVGASTYTDSYFYRFGRSFFNNANRGFGNDPGVMYETNANVFKAWSEVGMPSNGGGGSAGISFVNTGLTDKQLKVPSSDYVEITLREVGKVGFFYDGTATTATTASVSLNGVVIGSLTLGGNTRGSHSGFVTMPYGLNTTISDTIRITSDDGDLFISGFGLQKTSTVGPYLYGVPRGGWTFDDFNTTEKVQEITTMLNFNKSTSSSKVVVIALGTNSIYQAGGRAQTPTEYINSLDSLITNIKALSFNTNFAVSVPPRANPSLYNVEVGGGVVYEDYVSALVDYSNSKGLLLVRNDKTILGEAPYEYYDDGLHPTNKGHEVLANVLCNALGINYDPYVKTINFTSDVVRAFEKKISDFPGSGGAPTIKWVDAPFNSNRVLSVSFRNSSGTVIPVDQVADFSAGIGLMSSNQGTSTRFFYLNSNGFATSTSYWATTGQLDSSDTDATLVVRYI